MYNYTTARALQEERYRNRPPGGSRFRPRFGRLLDRNRQEARRRVRLTGSPGPAFPAEGRVRSWLP